MKKILFILFFFVAFYAEAQQLLPKGTPYPFSTGWARSGYYQADSAVIVGLRDTSWAARFVGSMIYYRTATDTSLFIWNGLRWVGVAGTPTPINPNDFIRNQYSSKQTATFWADSGRLSKLRSDSIVSNSSVASRLKLYWEDTSNYTIEVPSTYGTITKNINFKSFNNINFQGYQTSVNSSNGFYANSCNIPRGTLGLIGFTSSTFSPNRFTYPTYAYAPGTDISFIGGAPVQGAGATDFNGGTVTISGGISTGSGTSQIVFKTATAGSTGTTDRTPSIKVTIRGSGVVNIANAPSYADNTAALSGGLVAGDIYQTSGALKIVF